MHKTLALLAAAGLAATAGVAVAQTADATSGASGGYRVVERALTDTTTDTGAKGDTVGDILTFANPIYGKRNLHRIGADNGACTRTAVGKAYECSWTTTLKGGSLMVEGPFYDSRDSTLAITGGTGKWAGARGQMTLHARNKAGSAYDFTFSVR